MINTEASSQQSIPIHTFIVKIASRCNLDCSYCFVYNREDSSWKSQPRLMNVRTADKVASRIREHCEAHEKDRVSIVFHGGEPLLGGVNHLASIADSFIAVFEGSNIQCSYGMQSNGLLLSKDIIQLLSERSISFGISCDGPSSANIFRVDHRGTSTSTRLEEKLELLAECSENTFSGFLSVINLDSDPAEVFDYLMRFNPKKVDFLLPYDNHSRYPPGKKNFESVEYGRWLVRLYDHWIKRNTSVGIRCFSSLIQVLVGGHSLVESIGLDPVDLVVVETNGNIEAVDSLKAAVKNSTWLGFDVFENSFDDVLDHAAIVARQAGLSALCETCKTCSYVPVCGGGYLPNRFSSEKRFDNPSVYCHDMMMLIDHIRNHVILELASIGCAK